MAEKDDTQATLPGAVPDSTRLAGAARPDGKVPAVDAEELLAGRKEILIVHNGQTYRLRCTQSGKLILTK